MDAPDVKMLCAIAQHESALNIVSSSPGISALALVAGEGNLSAIVANENLHSQQTCNESARGQAFRLLQRVALAK